MKNIEFDSFTVWMLLAVFVPFVFRLYRGNTGPLAFVYIDQRFRAYRNGEFAGDGVEVLFCDHRIDRYAKGSFFEHGAPRAAIYICVDSNGRYYLWKLYEPVLPEPTLTGLSKAEAEEMLSRKDSLLEDLCPKRK